MAMQHNGPAHLARVDAGMELTAGMEGRTLSRSGETAAAALAAHAHATMQARIFLARTNPRDWDRFRVLLLKECRRKGFATIARYAKPVGGKKIEGWSVRFAETAYRLLGNVALQTTITFDSETKRGLVVGLLDLEANASIESPVLVDKTVERSDPKGQVPLNVRINSEGREVFLVAATEDDLANKVNSAIAKARRNNILQFIPGDVLEECLLAVKDTLTRGAAEDPDGFKKQIVDGFASLRVLPDALRSYLGHGVDECSPGELADLRTVYAAIRDNEATWQDFVRAKDEGTPPPLQAERPSQPSESAPKPSKAEAMAAQVNARNRP